MIGGQRAEKLKQRGKILENEKALKIFEAIKNDDLNMFSSLLTNAQDFQICFGRFPMLSVCYLFESYKILSRFENRLLAVNRFDKCEEYFEIYKKFKSRAKKCLRLYVGGEKIVYPIEMLAILDERRLIKDNYKKLFKNEEILNNLSKIYILNHKTEVRTDMTKFEILPKKLTKVQKVLVFVVSFVFMVASLFSCFSVVYVSLTSGLGTSGSPITISTEEEFVSALASGQKHFVLDDDLTFNEPISFSGFSGVIDGDGHTVELNYSFTDELLTSLSGTIRNMQIIVQDIDIEISQNFAILTENNSGNIENVQIYCSSLSILSNASEDVYIAIFACTNSGTISNSSASVTNVEVQNNAETNCYYSGIVGENNGTIMGCTANAGEGIFDTVDASGIASINNGEVVNSINYMNLSQTSSKEWHPNTSGIVLTNYGTISRSINYGNISSESTLETGSSADLVFYVFAGGIVCDNYGRVEDARNFGDISATGNISYSYVGGIVAMNQISDTFAGVVSYSKSKGSLTSVSTNNEAYAGGVAGFNSGGIDHSGFEGEIEVSSQNLGFGGGVVGFNRMLSLDNYVSNSYAEVTFSRVSTDDSSNIYCAGVVGLINTNMRFENNHYVQNSSFVYAVYGGFNFGGSFFVQGYEDANCGATGHASLEDIDSGVLLDDEI